MTKWFEIFVTCLMVTLVIGGNQNEHHPTSTERSISNNIPRPIYSSSSSDIDQGPAYLAAMINQLNTERNKIMGPTPVPDDYDHPPPPIPHSDLSALYNNAVNKLKDVDLNKLPTDPDNDPNTSPGYYYYYFPITDGPTDQESNTETSTDNMLMMMDDGNNAQIKQVEPLFVAIAGFIGISTLFAFSVLFLPKFGSHRKRSEANTDGLTRTVMDALEDGPEKRTGEPVIEEDVHMQGCKARMACEVGRALRRLQLHQGPLRALERILPSTMGKQVQRVRESAHRRDKCSTIRCHSHQ